MRIWTEKELELALHAAQDIEDQQVSVYDAVRSLHMDLPIFTFEAIRSQLFRARLELRAILAAAEVEQAQEEGIAP